MEPPLLATVDALAAFAPVTASVASHGVPSPLTWPLAAHRERAAEAAIARHFQAAWEVTASLRGGEAGAREALDGLVTTALAEMRADVAERAGQKLLSRIAADLDRLFHAPNGLEILDGTDVDEATRARVVRHLHAINGLLGNYDAFYGQLRPYLRAGSRVLDLAAGRGGFAIAAARRAAGEGLSVEFVATDWCSTSLAIGRAAAGDLPVTFEHQDALDLRNREPASFDVVTSTQALHHFRPGQIAVMLAEATRVARRRVVFLDGARCPVAGALVTAFGSVAFQDGVWARDTWMSFRRFFVPEELRVIARLAVPHRNVVSDVVAPGHCRVVVTAGG